MDEKEEDRDDIKIPIEEHIGGDGDFDGTGDEEEASWSEEGGSSNLLE